jgi:hypothetical protein
MADRILPTNDLAFKKILASEDKQALQRVQAGITGR